MKLAITPDPRFDLVLERTVDVPKELLWAAWTTPEHLKKWFTPAPWSTSECEIDLRPGGIFRAIMQTPEGETFPHTSCYLEIIPNEKLVWTTVLGPGYRPVSNAALASCGTLAFTAFIVLEPHGDGTKYTATVCHADEESCRSHEGMGFHQGWGAALDQLVAVAKSMQAAKD